MKGPEGWWRVYGPGRFPKDDSLEEVAGRHPNSLLLATVCRDYLGAPAAMEARFLRNRECA